MLRLIPRSIRGQFTLFAIALALPLLAVVLYVLYDRVRDDFAAAEALAGRMADANAARASDYMMELRATLESIAKRPQVRAMGAGRCDSSWPELADLYPSACNVIRVEPQGATLCATRARPNGITLRIVYEGLQREMNERPRFLVSKPIVSRVSGRWIISAVQPVFDEQGRLRGTLGAGTDLLQWRTF